MRACISSSESVLFDLFCMYSNQLRSKVALILYYRAMFENGEKHVSNE